jgi:hypothetical protein
MTTSGIVTFSIQRDTIVQDALFDAGVLGVGESLADTDLQFCSRRLNMLVKQWQGKQDFAPGLKMFARKRADLFLSSTTGQYTLGPGGTGWASSFTQISLTAGAAQGAGTITVSSIVGLSSGDNIGVVLNNGVLQWTTINGAPSGSTVTLTATLTGAAASGDVVYSYPLASQARRPLEILTAVLRDSNNNDVPMSIFTLQDYESLPTKVQTTNPADPMTLYYEAQLTNGILYTDAPAALDTSKHIHMVYLGTPEDFNAATDTPDFPQEWYLALVTGLAINVAPAYEMPITQDMKDNFARALRIAQEANPETSSMFFQCKQDDYAPWGNM